MCYKQKCKVVSLNLAHPVVVLVYCGYYYTILQHLCKNSYDLKYKLG